MDRVLQKGNNYYDIQHCSYHLFTKLASTSSSSLSLNSNDFISILVNHALVMKTYSKNSQ